MNGSPLIQKEFSIAERLNCRAARRAVVERQDPAALTNHDDKPQHLDHLRSHLQRGVDADDVQHNVGATAPVMSRTQDGSSDQVREPILKNLAARG
jgi:hypothetical protein